MLTPSPLLKPIQRRTRRDPQPRFKPDVSGQLDAIAGCPAVFVANDHPVRAVREIIRRLDCGDVERKYSSLGRHGFAPMHVLGALVYGSLIGLHHSTKLARAMKTDAALRFIAGGHSISEGALRRFRRENRALFERALAQTFVMARELDLIDTDEMSVDSVRLRAHASTEAVLTLTRSEKRLEELSTVDVAQLSPGDLEKHQARIEKHKAAISECTGLGRTNVVRTSPSASLMKFPSGASGPGHRVTVTATGTKARFVLDLLIDGAANDFGQLQGAAERTREALKRAGVDVVGPFQLAADAGYFSEADVIFAAANQEWVNVLLRERPEHGLKSKSGEKFFTRANFIVVDDKTAFCPAGTKMVGPRGDGPGRLVWKGVGCAECPLKSRCTDKKSRQLSIRPEFEKAKLALRTRMESPGAEERYNQRIATIEPVFSVLEDAMGFRRVSSRKEETVRAEITLKFLAYNISRLIAARKLCRVRVMLIWDLA
ncbi:MAG: transposase [Archangiaceae bacterium]|nr:transposase [Archangiaceae bacterium]